jgi:hypothetical protein
MRSRLPVLALALVFLVPSLGRAETRAAYAPYEDSRDDTSDCISRVPGGSCNANADADELTGKLGTTVAVVSPDGGARPGIEDGVAQAEIWDTLQTTAGSTIVVTATFRVISASAYRTGTLVVPPLSDAFAYAYLQVVHQNGCTLTNGCLGDGNPMNLCISCGSASATKTIVDLREGITSVHGQDFTITVTLKHPTGVFPAGNLFLDAIVYSEAALNPDDVPGEGSAGVSVDAVLTSIVAEIS